MTEPTTPAPRVTSHTYEGDSGPCRAEAYGQTCGAPRDVHELDEGHAPLLPEREQEIRESDPGDWYRAPWTTDYVEGNGEADDPSYWRVISEGATIATLPDFAGNLALFIAEAREAVPELLAELDRVRAERDKWAAHLNATAQGAGRLQNQVDRLTAERNRAVRAFESLAQKHDKAKTERDELRAEAGPTRAVLDEIHAERARQEEKWGEQNHPDVDPRDIPYVTHGYYASHADIWRQVNEERAKPSRSLGRCTGHPEGPHPHTAWDGVLLEKAYEALAEEDPARLRAELIQVAAVAVAWVEAIDRRAAAPAEGTDH
ncbi:hypothetical protein V2J94_41570 [Streptomyces sp. DSM 41524]|uniref:Uncharacterized protein n=1 Tax=Streptomyces asiaticus subsp. ignotus TaxID=3098222 RepID=A0ABU7QCA6_9ACTN|nr:hypothetical protein [Streptomyces sp. DSM 41524]